MKTLLSFIIFITCSLMASAQSYIVIAKESRIFDQPNVRSYPTTNTSGTDVVLVRGMAFKSIGGIQNGWYKIEYTPGLNAFILQSQIADSAKLGMPASGIYSIANSMAKLTVTLEGNEWKATDGTSSYSGSIYENVVVFTDKFGNTAYTLVVLEGNPMVFSYNNDITKFF